MLAQRHAERPLQGEGSLPCLLNTMRTKPVEQKRFYNFLQRMSQNAGALKAEEQRRVDAILGSCGGRGRSATSGTSSIQQRRPESRRRCSSAGRARSNGGGA